MYTPSLPYRRLVKFANGIWDENRKTFYPFKTSTASVPAKRGIQYFVKSASMSGANTGDHAVSNMNWYCSLNGSSVTFCVCTIPATTNASGVSSGNSAFTEVNQLFDANSAISRGVDSAASYQAAVTYAEIPVEGTGVPVVVA